MYWDVVDVKVLDAHLLQVTFADGLSGEVRFEPSFFTGVFADLIDPENFKKVQVVSGAVTWPGERDLAPDAMYIAIAKQSYQQCA